MQNALKSIALLLDESQHASGLADHAAKLAKAHDAHLIGIYLVSKASEILTGYARGEGAIREAVAHLKQENEQKALAASRHLAELASKYQITVEFRVLWLDASGGAAPLRSLHCDLLVVGHPASEHLSSDFAPEQLMLATGLPLLVVPTNWEVPDIGHRVVLAWNGSREARRAISDAMPIIEAAEHVSIVLVDADRGDDAVEDTAERLTAFLAHHGVTAEVQHLASGEEPVVQTIVSSAFSANADLLVIGAYSHARLSEKLFGGVTDTLLSKTPIPLLVSR